MTPLPHIIGLKIQSILLNCIVCYIYYIILTFQSHTLSYLFLSLTFVQPVPFLSSVTCNRSHKCWKFHASFLFALSPPLPSVPPSKMGESEYFNYYNIHTYVHLQAILLPASRLHLVSTILHLVQFRVFFLPCHILLHSVLNTCTPSSAYSSTLYLSLTLPLPLPSPISLPLLPSD